MRFLLALTGTLSPCYGLAVDVASPMAKAGVDVVVAHLGLTGKGSIGATTATTLEEAPTKVQEQCDTAKSVDPDATMRCHGGPISMLDDAQYIP